MVEQLRIYVVTGRNPYPMGMAAAQRIHLIARALAETGAAVQVLVDGLDATIDCRNIETVGVKDGIPFEFLIGKTNASAWKLRRIWDRLVIAAIVRYRLMRAARCSDIDALYFYTPVSAPKLERWIVSGAAKSGCFPIAIDLCEAPWTLKKKPSLVERRVSPLFGIRGVICISRFLEDWAAREAAHIGADLRSVYVPILVDCAEVRPADGPAVGKTVVFAGSPAYDETMRFLVSAMEFVWARHADCRLVITGGATEATLGSAAIMPRGRICYAGFLERRSLLRQYQEASVLAIPMFDDIRSIARFPTKLGEYLASGRPVVANKIGEISSSLDDGINAFLPRSGDPGAFGEAIIRLLDDPGVAQAMGRKGRQVAERQFHYANYGVPLSRFFASLSPTRRCGTIQ
jgi:glycosyltransferase involved in cell wall biosynthesis